MRNTPKEKQGKSLAQHQLKLSRAGEVFKVAVRAAIECDDR